MAKMLVPALTLPVRGATELVATMPGAGVALRGAQRDAGTQRARSGRAAPRPPSVSAPAALAGDRDVGQQRRPAASSLPASAASSSNCASIAPVVAAGGDVDREHAAGVADAEHLLARSAASARSRPGW